MTELRLVIDQIDADLIGLLARRQRCIDQAILLKQKENLPALIPDRVNEVLDNVAAKATATGLDPDVARFLWQEIIRRAIAREDLTLSATSPMKDET